MGARQEDGAWKALKKLVWRQDNQPKELVSNAFKDEKLQYVHRNPVEAGLVGEPEHYAYSSAMDYAGGKGLVEVSLL